MMPYFSTEALSLLQHEGVSVGSGELYPAHNNTAGGCRHNTFMNQRQQDEDRNYAASDAPLRRDL